MNNVVQLPIIELHKLIETATETRKLQPLLDAIKLACQEKTNFAPIIHAWVSGKNNFGPVSFDEFALFLQEFEFELPITETVPRPDDREISEAVKACHASGKEIVRQMTELVASPEFQSEQKKLRADYGSFEPARQLAHLLPVYFKVENPGSVIGQYADQMYAGTKDDLSPNYSRYLVSDKRLAETILEIGKSCLQADALCIIGSKKMFDRALNYIILSHEDETGFDCIKNCGPFFETIEIASPSLLLKLLWKWGNASYDQYHPGSLPAFAEFMNRVGMDEPWWKKSGRSLPYHAVNLIYARITDVLVENNLADVKTDDVQFLDAVRKLLDRARIFARRNLGGRSPLTMDVATEYALWEWGAHANWETYDLRFELAHGLHPDCIAYLDVWDKTAHDNPPVDLLGRCDTYLKLFDACEEEGLQHLASAVLAFFVFSQAVAHKGNLGTWCEIAKRVERATKYPGQEMVEQALQFTAAFAHESFPLAELAIRSLLANPKEAHSSNVVDISIARAAAMRSRAEFEDEWKERLSPLRWNKLSTKCQNFLVAGDQHWSRISLEFWKEEMDFGSVGLDYAKAFEAELGKRLEWLPTSTLFIKHCESVGFKPPKQMTLGAIVETLRGKHPLPESLRHEVENAGVHCHNNNELMKQLKKLAALRNKAAHPTDEFGPMQYTEMMLLIRKILPTFVDSLSS